MSVGTAPDDVESEVAQSGKKDELAGDNWKKRHISGAYLDGSLSRGRR
jgi:hypothetical protein